MLLVVGGGGCLESGLFSDEDEAENIKEIEEYYGFFIKLWMHPHT